MKRLLYFPTIAVPKNSWLRQSLLYWDGISSMVPADFWNLPERHNPGMLEMVRDGFVSQEPIYPHIQNLPDFERNFMAYLDANPRDPGQPTANWENVHVEKIGYGELGEFLQKQGLAKHERGMWMQMEPRTADEFMAYLATCIANGTKPNQFAAATDDQRVLQRLATRDTSRVRFSQRAVETLLPSPSEDIDLRRIVEFRAENQQALDRLRSNVQRRIDRNILANPDNAEELFELELEELKAQAKQIESQLSRRNWGRVSFGSLTGLGSSMLGAEPLLDGALAAVDVAVSLGVLSAVAATLSGFQSERPTGLMTYAVLAGREFR